MTTDTTYDLMETGFENDGGATNYPNYFFIGIGGIGMSALARYFKHIGKTVCGYDKTQTELTSRLQNEGIAVHFDDHQNLIPKEFNADNTQVVYTPAIPSTHTQLNYFLSEGFNVKKRSQILGDITKDHLTIAVAGTHGKTTTSTMIAQILHFAGEPCTAFLGGISTNFQSNLLVSDNAIEQIIVVEADEYDRSMLTLFPDIAIITSIEPDHLDIYGKPENLAASFKAFARKVPEDGSLIAHARIDIINELRSEFTYSLDSGDYFTHNIKTEKGKEWFSASTPEGIIRDIPLQQPGRHNIENAIGAIAAVQQLGIPNKTIKKALANYSGVKRRFEYIINSEDMVFIDDYAHHPTEIESLIRSVRNLYPRQKITVIFQPHLYSRTRDFANGFAASLSLADHVILCPIYPAREEPINGVNSEMLLKLIQSSAEICPKQELEEKIKHLKPEVLLTVGAGDIDKEVLKIKKVLES